MTANDSRDDNASAPKILTSQIEGRLVRYDFTNEVYMSLSSTNVLKRKNDTVYVPPELENGLKLDALADSGAYVTAIALTELHRIKQQGLANIFKIDDSPNFLLQIANGQLEKPIATATLKFDIGDKDL